MTALATVADLGVRLGITLTGDARAAAILDDVSARVRSYTGRTFTQQTATETVDVCCGKATLAHGPVISITSVKVDGVAVAYDTWASGRALTGIDALVSAVVVYVYGYASVPADILAVVCQIAGRAYGTNPQDAGTTTESLGGWSIGTGGAAAAGPLGLLSDERAALNAYVYGARGPIRMDVWA